MGRGMHLALAGAVVVGSVGGGLVALATSPANHARPVVAGRSAPPAAAASAPPSPTTAIPAGPPPQVQPLPDPHHLLATSMTAVLTRFADWARDHAGEPCPDATTLGVTALDPWSRPLELTCSDQPADQMIGAISAGPDGVAGSADDVASWSLGREITGLVRGARWKPAAAAATRTRPVRHRTPPATPVQSTAAPTTTPSPTSAPAPAAAPPPSTVAPTTNDGDDIPSRRSPR